MCEEIKARCFIPSVIIFTVAIYICCMLTPLVGRAQAATGTVTVDVANIRSEPSTQSSVAGTVYKNTSVNILSQSGEWYQIQVGSVTGWMNQSVLAANSPANSSPAAVTTPKVILDGQLLSFDVQPTTINDRIMVPMAHIFEVMGAAVEWNGATQTVTATRGTTRIVLPIGSCSPTVNGVVWPIDVPARVVNDRTLAPLRFVGEALGGTVNWDEANYAAIMTSPAAVTGKVTAVIVGSTAVNLRSGPGTSYGVVDKADPGEKLTVIGSEQAGWYLVSRKTGNAWVAGWVVTPVWESDGTQPDSNPATPDTDPDQPDSNPGTTTPATASGSLTLSSRRDTDGLKIIMESTVELETKKTVSSNQVNYQFDDQQISGTASLQEYLGAFQVLAQGSNQTDKAVVTITFPTGMKYETYSENGGKREVFLIPNYISNVSRKTFGSSGEIINVDTIASLEYTSSSTSSQLKVVFNNVLLGSASATYKYSSPIISSVGFKTQTNSGQTDTILTINTTKPAKFSVGSNDDGTGINIMFIGQSELKSPDPIVVLDAGHGGKDPGASGAYLAEKTVNLDVVQKAGQILAAKGIKVVYTRQDDTYVSLDERSNIANFCNAAVFVSVHCNASTSSTPSGTETFCYYPVENPQLYLQKDERYNLALRIQQALMASLGRIDRGVKQDNLAVLRETTMPSALAELAFLSNPTEEALLQQQQFRDKAAQAIADAIIGYMQTYVK